MTRSVKTIRVLSTRLFPKNRGANAYQLTGIASRCDWVVLTDGALDKFDVSLRGDLSIQPRTVFLSLRSCFEAIPYFYEEILPKIEAPFVLVSGSEDVTVPNQVDARWRRFNPAEKEIIDKIINDERVIHWFAENRDEQKPKMSTLPVGYVFEDSSSDNLTIEPMESWIAQRPINIFCSHRVREGTQWETRNHVTRLCQNQFQEFSTVTTEELHLANFRRTVRSHPFVLCVHGGGLDPSPKAWYCIANGSIPVIKSSVLDDAYSQLPVAFVDDWNDECLSLEKLHDWREKLAPYYDRGDRRAETLYRLSLDYWWKQIMDKWYFGTQN